jgi:prepilin-type N-terminal cleavage/methylation domain-containing protein/prepilin-type processing-associated H-X9-DG protein
VKQVQRGFTMVELLVVLVVIAILTSLMGSSLALVRSCARKVACTSNLMQMGVASQLYWADHEQHTFDYVKQPKDGGMLYWFGWLGGGKEGQRVLDRTRGALWPYTESKGIGVCPSFPYHRSHYKAKATTVSFGYGYNLHLACHGSLGKVSGFSHRSIAQLASPSKTVLFADAAQINDFQPPASRDHPLVEEFYYISDGPALYANGHFRHSGTAMAVFCDGHVAAESPREGSLDIRIRKAGIARLRTEVLVP